MLFAFPACGKENGRGARGKIIFKRKTKTAKVCKDNCQKRGGSEAFVWVSDVEHNWKIRRQSSCLSGRVNYIKELNRFSGPVHSG